MKGGTGGSLGGKIVYGEKRRKRRAKAKKRQEEEWASKNGPVIVRLGDREVYVKSDRIQQDLAAARRALLGGNDDPKGEGDLSANDDVSPSHAAPA